MAYTWQKKKYHDTHEKLLEVASKTLRRDGVEKTSVAKVMAGAGLTVGAFYAHFDSKKDLVEKSFAWAVNASKERIDRIPDSHPGEKLAAFLDRSLSVEHRDAPDEGCPLSALSLDFSREDEDTRQFFAEILSKTLKHRVNTFSREGPPLSEDDLIEFHSTLVGALILARATRGSELSERWMQVVKARLKARFLPDQDAI